MNSGADHFFDLMRRYSVRARRLSSPLDGCLAGIVPISFSVLDSMGRRISVALGVKEEPRQ